MDGLLHFHYQENVYEVLVSTVMHKNIPSTKRLYCEYATYAITSYKTNAVVSIVLCDHAHSSPLCHACVVCLVFSL